MLVLNDEGKIFEDRRKNERRKENKEVDVDKRERERRKPKTNNQEKN